MAEPLKNIFNVLAVRRIATLIETPYPAFDADNFVDDASRGLNILELLPRAKHIARALRTYLPQDIPQALDVIVRSLPTPPHVEENHEFSPFLYMPFNIYVAENGLEHFDDAMLANLELTQRFTSEFSIRPFLVHHQDRTLQLLHTWATHPNHHVRRLVSEGTRPRLPWASRLPVFQKNPKLVLELLEKLKDDEVLYVRRSVANNLNDIGKDNPDVLFATATSWLNGADENRTWVVNHALRSSIKRGEMEAFKVLGFDTVAVVDVQNMVIDPALGKIGSTVCISFSVINAKPSTQHLLVDIAVYFVKANGSTSPKIFKLSRVTLAAGESRHFKKTISLKQHTTRTHYPGEHRVEVLVNGRVLGARGFAISSYSQH